ncbi:MAG: sulfur carrier protein ThiS [Nitrospinota bacterium]|nr:sulfur carrier protein ThiS [Nitrospinota bacterium]
MKIKVNNEYQEFDGEITVSELLTKNNVEMPDMVSVQLNGEFVKRDNFSSTSLTDQDEINFLYFLGGGNF